MKIILMILLAFVPRMILGEDPLPPCQLNGMYKCDIDCLCPDPTLCDENIQLCLNPCGNGLIEGGETCSNCKEDYACPPLTQCVSYAKGCISTCGNESCETYFSERCDNCADCACDDKSKCDEVSGRCVTRCGDGICESSIGETASQCPDDCQRSKAVCLEESGDTCDSSPACSCPANQYCQGGRCMPRCGNGVCEFDAPENFVTCYEDCRLHRMRGCQSGTREGSMLVRASRRGEIKEGRFIGETIPSAWPPSYDTDKNQENFARWTPIGLVPMNNSASPPMPPGNASAARGRHSKERSAWVQVNDPSSQTSPLRSGELTTLFAIDHIFGLESARLEFNAPTRWSAYLAVDRYFSKIEEAAAVSWSTDQWGLAIAKPPLIPPSVCDPTPCDTLHDTVPYPPRGRDSLHYGPNPDSKVPYVVMTKKQPWMLLTGGVDYPFTGDVCKIRLEPKTDNCVFPSISVVVVDRFNRFPPIEKLTDGDGNFQIIVPYGDRLRVLINAKFPPDGIAVPAHTYNPAYETRIHPNVSIRGDMAEPGHTNTFDLGVTLLRPSERPLLTGQGTGILGGLITVSHMPNYPLKDVPLYLRNADGKIVSVKKTDATGRYVFETLDSGRYFVEPILRKGQLAVPIRHTIELPQGKKSTHHDFRLEGVTGTLLIETAQGGTLIAVTPKEWIPLMHEPFSIEKQDTSSLVSSDDHGIASARPRAGLSYYVTCWIPDEKGVFSRYPPLGSLLVNDGRILLPDKPVKMKCP